MAKPTLEQMAEDLEMKERVARQAAQEQSNLDAEERRGVFPPWYLKKLADKRQQPDGSEIPDPTVVEPPVGTIDQPTIMESVYNLIRQEKLRQGDTTMIPDSPEEADDFDIPDPDDLEPHSRYEFEDGPQSPSDVPTEPEKTPATPPPADGPPVPKPSPALQEVPLTPPQPKPV